MIARRAHAHYGHGVAIEQQFLVQDAGIAGEARSPVVVGEDDYWMRPWQPVVVRSEAAAQDGLDAQSVEPGAGDEFGLSAVAAAVVADIHGRVETTADAFEYGVVVAQVVKHR